MNAFQPVKCRLACGVAADPVQRFVFECLGKNIQPIWVWCEPGNGPDVLRLPDARRFPGLFACEQLEKWRPILEPHGLQEARLHYPNGLYRFVATPGGTVWAAWSDAPSEDSATDWFPANAAAAGAQSKDIQLFRAPAFPILLHPPSNRTNFVRRGFPQTAAGRVMAHPYYDESGALRWWRLTT